MRPLGLVGSYPKSGRTWLRFALFLYLNETRRLGLPVDFASALRLLPNFSDDPGKGISDRGAVRGEDALRIFFHHYLPIEEARYRLGLGLAERPVRIFLLRPPRQTLVSAYHHYRDFMRVWNGSRSEFLADDRLGAASWVRYHNDWAPILAAEPPALTLSYAAMRADFTGCFRRVLAALGLPADEQAIRAAAEGASAERMRALEDRLGGFPGRSAGAVPDDPDARRIRTASADRPRFAEVDERLVAAAIAQMSPAALGWLDRARVDLRD